LRGQDQFCLRAKTISPAQLGPKGNSALNPATELRPELILLTEGIVLFTNYCNYFINFETTHDGQSSRNLQS